MQMQMNIELVEQAKMNAMDGIGEWIEWEWGGCMWGLMLEPVGAGRWAAMYIDANGSDNCYYANSAEEAISMAVKAYADEELDVIVSQQEAGT